MLKYLPHLIYVFLILWIIPCYPHYRSFLKTKWKQILMCLLCAVAIVSVIIVFAYENADQLVLIAPLLIVCSYVDHRDQEIPDLPVVIMFLFARISGKEMHWLLVIGLAAVSLPFIIQGMLGLGDCKLMSVMVMINGYIAMIGFAIGSVICMAANFRKKESSEQKIPFAPYLCTGFLISLLFAV